MKSLFNRFILLVIFFGLVKESRGMDEKFKREYYNRPGKINIILIKNKEVNNNYILENPEKDTAYTEYHKYLCLNEENKDFCKSLLNTENGKDELIKKIHNIFFLPKLPKPKLPKPKLPKKKLFKPQKNYITINIGMIKKKRFVKKFIQSC